MNNLQYTVVVGILLIIIILIYSSNKKNEFSVNDRKNLLNIIASLKLRVFDHEKYILNRDGVYIPEDMGEYYFKQTWGMLDEQMKETIKEEYKKVCPKEIPLWKYFLYAYKPNIEVSRKIELKKIDSVEELIFLSTKNISDLQKQFDELEQQTKNYSQVRDKVLNEIEKVADDVENIDEKVKE